VGVLLTLSTIEPVADPNAAESVTVPADWPVTREDDRLTAEEFVAKVAYPSMLNEAPFDIPIAAWMVACSYSDVQWTFLSATTGTKPDGECFKLKVMVFVTSTTLTLTEALWDAALGYCGKLTVAVTLPKVDPASTNKFSAETCAATPRLEEDIDMTVRVSALMSLIEPSEKYSVTVKAVLVG